MSDVGILARLSESLRGKWRERGDLGRRSKGKGAPVDRGPEQLFLRARITARAGDLDMAARLYEDAAALEPTFAEALEAQGEILDMAGRSELGRAKYEAAREVRAKVRQGPPDRPFATRQRGNFTPEILAYNSVLRSLKKNALPYLARGNAHLAEGRPELALADYDHALKLKPALLDVTTLRAEALAQLGRFPEALSACNAVLAIRPTDAETLNERAVVLMALGRVEEANADWRRQFDLLAADRVSARACVALRMADYDKALAALSAALLREPADPYWRLYRIAAQLRLGIPTAPAEAISDSDWPAPLVALHAGHKTEAEVMALADTACRRAEALFQLGVLAVSRDRAAAERHWRQIVDRCSPSMIEFAAARNELARLGS